MEITKAEIRETTKLNKIAEPWEKVTTEREHCKVTLRSGREITMMIPLGAAVEIEEAGHPIRVE